MFTGGKGLAAGIFAGDIGGFIKKAALVGIVGPWAGDFVEEFVRLGLDNVNIDEDTKKMIMETANDSVSRAIQGAALFGPKGAIIGALSGPIEAAAKSLADAFGIDLNKEVMKVGDVSIDGNDVAAVGSVGLSAVIVTLRKSIMGAITRAAPLLIGTIMRGALAFFSGPLGWAAIAGTLGIAGVKWRMNKRQTAFDKDLESREWGKEASTDDANIFETGLARLGLGTADSDSEAIGGL
jgi:hypothetical protein